MDKDLVSELNKMQEPLSVAEMPRKYKILIYGEPGSGKTELAGHLMNLDSGPSCLVSTDSAWITLLKNEEVAKKVTRYPYEGFSQLRAIAQAAIEGIEPYCNYETLVWDTVSTAIDLTVAKLVVGKKLGDQRDPDIASWSHYGLAANALRPTIEALNKAPFNVIYVAHVRTPSDDDRKKLIFAIRPNTPEACFKQLSQEVQMIGWLNKEKAGGKRVLQVEGTNTVTGKSQVFTIPEGTYPVEDIPGLIDQWKKSISSGSVTDAREAMVTADVKPIEIEE